MEYSDRSWSAMSLRRPRGALAIAILPQSTGYM
jgi:hypothetical protein